MRLNRNQNQWPQYRRTFSHHTIYKLIYEVGSNFSAFIYLFFFLYFMRCRIFGPIIYFDKRKWKEKWLLLLFQFVYMPRTHAAWRAVRSKQSTVILHSFFFLFRFYFSVCVCARLAVQEKHTQERAHIHTHTLYRPLCGRLSTLHHMCFVLATVYMCMCIVYAQEDRWLENPIENDAKSFSLWSHKFAHFGMRTERTDERNKKCGKR